MFSLMVDTSRVAVQGCRVLLQLAAVNIHGRRTIDCKRYITQFVSV
jgi:hypothetical protein